MYMCIVLEVEFIFIQASHDRGLGSGSSSSGKPPVFGKPTEKKDSELHKITLVSVTC